MIDHEIKDAVRKSWDISSAKYDSCPGHGIGTGEEKAAWMQELARDLPEPPLRVLDAGCGTGVMGLLFAEMGHQVTGVDLSNAMMEKAREKACARNLQMELQAGDVEHLPFGDGSFDVVVNRHLLWTLPHPDMALREWHRVLAKGGTILIIDGIWKDNSFRSRATRKLSDGLARLSGRSHGGYYSDELRGHLPYDGGVSEEVMASAVMQAGFMIIHCRDIRYIQEIQGRPEPWYRRSAPGKTYYLLAAKRVEKTGF